MLIHFSMQIYIHRLEQNYVRQTCRFDIIRRKGATAYVEAHGSIGHTVAHRAMGLAVDLAEPDPVVLLSPACGSFDMFANYRKRGEAFTQAAVKAGASLVTEKDPR